MWCTKSHLTGLMNHALLVLPACTSTTDGPIGAPLSAGDHCDQDFVDDFDWTAPVTR